MTPKNTSKAPRSLRLNIMSAFTLLFMITMGLLVGYNYYAGYQNSIDMSKQIFRINSDLVIQKTMDFISPAMKVAQIMARQIKHKELSLENNYEHLIRYTTNTLKTYPNLQGIYYAVDKGLWGSERQVGNIINEAKRWRNKADTASHMEFIYKDFNGKIIKQKKFVSDWDTRTRPWYINSKDTEDSKYWSDPYIYIADREEIGITAVYNIMDGKKRIGAATIDIGLRILAKFLSKVKVGKNGYAFIIDENGRFVCFPNMDTVVSADSRGKRRLINLIEIKNHDYLISAYTDFAKKQQDYVMVTEGSTNHIVNFVDFPKSFGKQWKLVITAPENDFVTKVKENNLKSLGMTVIILLLSLFFITLISRNIAQPISTLTDETDKIKEMELDSEVIIDSSILEIQRIADSISKLKKGLHAFKKYVPETMVKQLIKTGEEARLGGRNEILTIFFSDIKSFTSISENLPPEYLGLHLSEYLDEMTRIIIEHNGTIDKYIGDAIMAFWGAPIRDIHQEVNACRASILCQRKLIELNAKWREERKPEFHTRIGIHTGPTVVGNIGSSERMNYTVLGDSVNLASRLEGVNKIFGTGTIISEETQIQLKDDFITRPLDIVTVKGKTEVVRIYELMDLNDEQCAPKALELSQRFSEAFELYIQKEWKSAIKGLEKILSDFPEDTPAQNLLSRCQQFLDNPPDDNWDGAQKGFRAREILTK